PSALALDDDGKDTAVVLTTRVWFDGLRRADQHVVVGMRGHESVEGAVKVDVVRDEDTAVPYCRPCRLELEPQIPLAVPAVVHEEVDRAELPQQRREAPAARALDVGPARSKRFRDRRADLDIQVGAAERRPVDAP